MLRNGICDDDFAFIVNINYVAFLFLSAVLIKKKFSRNFSK